MALPSPPAEPPSHVLLVSRNYMRLYPVDGVRSGDRTTAKKAFLEAPLVLAAPFHSPAGSAGVAAVTANCEILVGGFRPGVQVSGVPALLPHLLSWRCWPESFL